MRALRPHWGALLALGVFLAVGLAVLDDYGVTWDESYHRGVFLSKLTQLQGNPADIPTEHDKFYGGAFHFPLLFAERVFGLRETRDIYLSRHLITHFFFLVGGLFAYLLGHRLFRNGLLALFAMLAFLLHPRLYAHSFFNAQDIPFLSMFIVALFLAHRAFSRDRIGAFVLLGVGVGVLVNLRIMGIVPLAAIPALRALDFAFAQRRPERKRIILSTGAFALTATLVVYVVLPHLWPDPVPRAVEWWARVSNHPTSPLQLFRGMLYLSRDFPAEYLPIWFSITAPPFALFLGLTGAAAVLIKSAGARFAALRNTRLRFHLLALGCFTLPIIGIILLDANMYDDWRHVYFLWAPFSLLAALGLAWLVSAIKRARLRAAVYGAAGAGLAASIVSAALIHPNQQLSFNFLVDRIAPEHLAMHYHLEYWGHPMRQALEWLPDNANLFPPAPISGTSRLFRLTAENAALLPNKDKARIASLTDFRIHMHMNAEWSRSRRALHQVKVYGNTIMTVEPKDDLRAVYEATHGRQPVVDSAFDIYRLNDSVALVMEPCAPAFIHRVRLFARAVPVDVDDLPPWRKGKRFESLAHVGHAEYGALFDGKCVVALPLPGYPVADIEVEWSPRLLSDGAAQDAMRRTQEHGQLLARSFYDIHLADGELVYVNENCDPLETERPFYLSVFPQRTADLPEDRRGHGSERFWFDFHRNGAFVGDACVALFPLPAYPVVGFRTGQRGEGDGALWRASFSANPEPYRAVYRAVEGSDPLAEGAFDIHLSDGGLVYVKEPCEQADIEARFFLHVVPQSADDLPEDRREYGFNGLDFDFFRNGAWFDGKCAARVALPDYPVASVRTGQHVSGVREIWSAEFAVAEP